MITADKLTLLTNMPAFMLTQLLHSSGYKKDKVTEAKFLGLTNAGQFCYEIDYDNFGTKEYRKMFLTYDPAAGKVIADIG
jgi:hypothetical protein